MQCRVSVCPVILLPLLRLVAERAAGRKCRSIAAGGAWQQQQRRANAASATLTAGIYAVNK